MMLLALLILAVACGLAGLVMTWIGATATWFRDRCVCGYDLRGSRGTTLRCPECGRRGPFVDVKHRRLLTWGLVLFLIPPAVIALVLVLWVLLHL